MCRELEPHAPVSTLNLVLSRCAFFSICVQTTALLLLIQPGKLTANDNPSTTAAQQKALDDARKLAPPGFTALIQAPFIVVGDEPAAKVRQRAESTVKWSVDRLKEDFFVDDPDEVITIWLFKDKQSYETNTQLLFHEAPLSPYGYYSPRHRALIMNISTGAGTLVHEIVHPYVRSNFLKCPAWFNEGLGSLFEACEDRDGHICGVPNWRLPGLQKVIRESHSIPFEEFTAMSDKDFYSGSEGYNQHYGQARYLCYYLQERGLLIKFYREFLMHAADDPTGFRSLKKILKTDDMVKFQRQWESFVLKLNYP